MLKLAFIVYRKWAFKIYQEVDKYRQLRKDFEIAALITTFEPEFKITEQLKKEVKVYSEDPKNQKRILEIFKENKIDAALFYGWSSMIDSEVINKYLCLCLHPALLPNYRGGSPIQTQLISGEKTSGVSVFKMNEGIDSGDIYQQVIMSTSGDLNDIFFRMTNLGIIITKNFITDYINVELVFTPQKDLEKHPPLKRRKPSQSELSLESVSVMAFEEVNNLVRGLLSPYPNAFMKTDSLIVYLQEVIKYKALPQEAVILSRNSRKRDFRGKRVFLPIKDGYAWLAKYKIKPLAE